MQRLLNLTHAILHWRAHISLNAGFISELGPDLSWRTRWWCPVCGLTAWWRRIWD